MTQVMSKRMDGCGVPFLEQLKADGARYPFWLKKVLRHHLQLPHHLERL